MLAPTLDSLTLSSLAIAFLAAVSGSLHCVVMCGPIRMLSGNSFLQRALYQGGRMIGYLVLGALAGFMGFILPFWILLPLIILGMLMAFFPQIKFMSATRQKILRWCSTYPFVLGISSALLPCGLLHAWVGVAALSSRPFIGALVLFLLWLGSLPALELSSSVLLLPFNKLRAKFPRIVTGALILLALLPIGWRYSSTWHNSMEPNINGTSCPMHKH